MLAVQRHCLPATGCLAVTMIEDYLGCPFDQEKLPGGSIFVQGCHKAVFRFERDFVDPRIGGLLRLPFETELVAERIESPLSRVAFDLPGAIFPTDLRIVAK